MFTEQQLDQLRQLLSASEEKVLTRIASLEGEMKKSQEDQAELFEAMTVHIDESEKTIVATLTERISVALTHHDKRITRVEKHLDLPPLE